MVLLYPDKLAAVITPTDTCGYLVGPAIYVAVALPLFHTIGWLGVAAGAAIGGGPGMPSSSGGRSGRRAPRVTPEEG
jgi:hypothetical protein